jgi:hypothetical protein
MASHSHPLAVAGATTAMILVAVGTALAASSEGVNFLPRDERLPGYYGVIGLACSAAGYALGQWILHRRLEALGKPVSRVAIARREGGAVVTLSSEGPFAILGMSFVIAMFAPGVSLLFLLIPIVEFVKGNSIHWYEWAAGFATLAGALSAVGIIGAVLIAIPLVYARTVIDLDGRRIEIRRRRVIPRFRQRIPTAEIAVAETYYAGVEIRTRDGKATHVDTGGSQAENEMIRDLVRTVAGE